jgi:hypothetical protein
VLAEGALGRSVVSLFQACTSLGTSLQGSVELRLPSGKRTPIFAFVPNGGMVGCNGHSFPGSAEPTAIWMGPNTIRISLAVADSIVEMRTDVDGIHVVYEIGPVLSSVCMPSELSR